MTTHDIHNNDISATDLDTLLQNDSGRKYFTLYLKEFNNSSDNLLTLYLICCCFQNHQRIEDRQRIKQILEKTYNACFIKNQLPYLDNELKQKLGESLKKTTYNESVFTAVKKELKNILEHEHYPKFLKSKTYKDYLKATNNKLVDANENHHQQQADNLKHTVNGQKSKIALDEFIDYKENYDHQQHGESVFAMPTIPKTTSNSSLSKDTTTSNRLFKQNSSSSSASSLISNPQNIKKKRPAFNNSNNINSIKKSNSLVSKTSSSKPILQMPPNPYHVVSSHTTLPTSIQDSEIQSMVSGDIQFDDDANLTIYTNPNNNTKKANVSCNQSTISSMSKHSKFYKQIKQSIMANKNASLNMPSDEMIMTKPAEEKKKAHEGHVNKKVQTPISESDPKQFFELLSSKLEQVIQQESQQNSRPLKCKSFSNSHIPQPQNYSTSSLTFDNNKLLTKQQQPIDLDSQLDEHLDRVYNSNVMYSGRYQPFDLIEEGNESGQQPKMFTKMSNNASLINQFNRMKIEENYAEHASPTKKSATNQSNASFISLKTTGQNPTSSKSSKTNQNLSHHFYQLTTTCKEVDIDSQSDHNHKTSKTNKHSNTKQMHDNNLVNGSMRSAASIERVNDWLANNGYKASQQISEKYGHQQQSNDVKLINETSNKIKHDEIKDLKSNVKTTVAYFLPGEDVAYISTFNGLNLTLLQFKQLITKKGQFRYFFKTKSDLLDDEQCIVFQEATDDNAVVPMFNDKVIAKIEKIVN